MTTPKLPQAKPDTAIYDGHRAWYIAGFVCSLIALAFSAYFAHKHVLQGWEVTIFRHINDWPNSLHIYFKLASVTRDSTWIALIAVIISFICRNWRLAWRLAASTVAGFVVAFGLKHFIHRARPESLLQNVHLRWSDSGTGFPSGHVMVVTVILVTLIPYIPRKWRWVVPVGIVLVALSRMYLGLHAPLDVVGGFAVGLLVVCSMRIMPQSLRVFLRLD